MTDPSTDSKIYWPNLKTFFKNKKITLIQPLYIDKNWKSDFRLKAIHFSKYFAFKWTPIKNDGSLQSTLEFCSQSRISFLNITEDDIFKIVRTLDINKAHGHDEISVAIILKYVVMHLSNLQILYRHWNFPKFMEKINIVSVHKKGSKQLVD